MSLAIALGAITSSSSCASWVPTRNARHGEEIVVDRDDDVQIVKGRAGGENR